jgi:hypothetical protein
MKNNDPKKSIEKMKKDWPPSRDSRELIYSKYLLNIQYHCNMSHCTSMETSTGWLCIDSGSSGEGKGDFFLGFECPSDGLGGRWTPELQPLIDLVIREAKADGFDLAGEIRIRNEKHQQMMEKYRKKDV